MCSVNSHPHECYGVPAKLLSSLPKDGGHLFLAALALQLK